MYLCLTIYEIHVDEMVTIIRIGYENIILVLLVILYLYRAAIHFFLFNL